MAVENRNSSLNDVHENFEAFLQTICGPRFYTDAKKFAANHPFIFAAISSICLFSAVPLLFFLGFTVVTLFIALICFLCIEGSIIAIGGIIFIGVVSFISVIVIAILSAVAAAYWIIQQIHSLIYTSYHISNNSSDRINYVEEKTD